MSKIFSVENGTTISYFTAYTNRDKIIAVPYNRNLERGIILRS